MPRILQVPDVNFSIDASGREQTWLYGIEVQSTNWARVSVVAKDEGFGSAANKLIGRNILKLTTRTLRQLVLWRDPKGQALHFPCQQLGRPSVFRNPHNPKPVG